LLSLVLVITTLVPEADASMITIGLGLLVALGLGGLGVLELRATRRSRHPLDCLALDRDTWRMPPLPELPRPVWSTSRKAGMLALRGYLVVAALLLGVKVVQIALGQ
jgi:hypothetical protein